MFPFYAPYKHQKTFSGVLHDWKDFSLLFILFAARNNIFASKPVFFIL